jgi:hypothetical protein
LVRYCNAKVMAEHHWPGARNNPYYPQPYLTSMLCVGSRTDQSMGTCLDNDPRNLALSTEIDFFFSSEPLRFVASSIWRIDLQRSASLTFVEKSVELLILVLT